MTCLAFCFASPPPPPSSSSCSREGDPQTAPGGDPVDGEPAGGREDGARVDLPAARGERCRLEVNPRHHRQGELHQHDRQLQHGGHRVRRRARARAESAGL